MVHNPINNEGLYPAELHPRVHDDVWNLRPGHSYGLDGGERHPLARNLVHGEVSATIWA